MLSATFYCSGFTSVIYLLHCETQICSVPFEIRNADFQDGSFNWNALKSTQKVGLIYGPPLQQWTKTFAKL